MHICLLAISHLPVISFMSQNCPCYLALKLTCYFHIVQILLKEPNQQLEEKTPNQKTHPSEAALRGWDRTSRNGSLQKIRQTHIAVDRTLLKVLLTVSQYHLRLIQQCINPLVNTPPRGNQKSSIRNDCQWNLIRDQADRSSSENVVLLKDCLIEKAMQLQLNNTK